MIGIKLSHFACYQGRGLRRFTLRAQVLRYAWNIVLFLEGRRWMDRRLAWVSGAGALVSRASIQ